MVSLPETSAHTNTQMASILFASLVLSIHALHLSEITWHAFVCLASFTQHDFEIHLCFHTVCRSCGLMQSILSWEFTTVCPVSSGWMFGLTLALSYSIMIKASMSTIDQVFQWTYIFICLG